MSHQMPAMATCCECHRTFPVNAQMQTDQGSIPLLVVLPEVDSVEAALEVVTCQKCLARQGPVDRALAKILKGLGVVDVGVEQARPSPGAVVIASRDGSIRERGVVVVQKGPPKEVMVFDPLMGTSIQVTHQEPPECERRSRGSRRDDWRASPSEPRLSSVLRERKRDIEPEPKVEHLTGTLADSAANAAALETAMKAAKERDEAKRRVRLAKFGGLMGSLARLLARIRETAALTDVQNEVAQFHAKLSEAAGFDPKSRGKKRLTEHLGTSQGELKRLCYFFYEPRERRHIPNPEIIAVDAFEGDRRPEFWDQNGGMRPDFYVVQVEIVRTKPKKAKKKKGGGEGEEGRSPTPNDPLPTGDEPKIAYPDGGEYGSEYTTQNSRRKEPPIRPFRWELNPFGWDVISFASWLFDHPDLQVGGLNPCDLLCSFIEPFLMEEELAPSTNDPAIESTTTSPDLPATT